MDTNRVVSGSRNYLEAYFMFSPDWDGLCKTAVFNYNDTCYEMIIVNNECKVPWEVIEYPEFTVGVFGGDLITTNTVHVSVIDSGLPPTVPPGPATENVYNQLLELANDAYTKSNEALSIAEDLQNRAEYGEFDGEQGYTFTPSVSEDGTLSWTNNGDLENPNPVNIRGPQGEAGETPYVGENGNWWVGDTDTGVSTQPQKAELDELTETVSSIQEQLDELEGSIVTTEQVESMAIDLIEKHNMSELAHKELFDSVDNSWKSIEKMLNT